MTLAAEQSLDAAYVQRLATQLRIDAIRCSTQAGSGHPTSSMSAADVIAVLLARHSATAGTSPTTPTTTT